MGSAVVEVVAVRLDGQGDVVGGAGVGEGVEVVDVLGNAEQATPSSSSTTVSRRRPTHVAQVLLLVRG